MGLAQTVAPTEEPLSLEEAKLHLREDGVGQNTLISTLIIVARRYVETYLNQQLVTATWALTLDQFPSLGQKDKGFAWSYFDGEAIRPPMPPLIAVSSIVYIATDGTSTTLAASLYQVDAKARPGRIEPAYQEVWPATRSILNAVTVTYTAGYGAASAVPQTIKQAMKILIAFDYFNRVPVAADMARVHDLLRAESHGWHS